ncbi:hypothetical protein ACFYRY_32445 [Streptomyces sp. NPDC005263]|uniref:hypothetical protein n=1 Tax=Streptomyces sp. NPDC005263 TaxID=3364711 RepID=UPI0036B0EF17
MTPPALVGCSASNRSIAPGPRQVARTHQRAEPPATAGEPAHPRAAFTTTSPPDLT